MRSYLVAAPMVGVVSAFSATNAILSAPQQAETEYLFVQKSKECSFVKVGDDMHIVFDGLSNITTRFSDRPFRKDAAMGTTNFMGGYFADSFGRDLPNAAILFDNSDGVEVGPVVATIAPSTVDGKQAYTLTQSDEQAAEMSLPSLPGKTYSSCVAFIDDASVETYVYGYLPGKDCVFSNLEDDCYHLNKDGGTLNENIKDCQNACSKFVPKSQIGTQSCDKNIYGCKGFTFTDNQCILKSAACDSGSVYSKDSPSWTFYVRIPAACDLSERGKSCKFKENTANSESYRKVIAAGPVALGVVELSSVTSSSNTDASCVNC